MNEPVWPMSDGPASGLEVANPSLEVKSRNGELPLNSVTNSLNAVGSMSQSITRR